MGYSISFIVESKAFIPDILLFNLLSSGSYSSSFFIYGLKRYWKQLYCSTLCYLTEHEMIKSCTAHNKNKNKPDVSVISKIYRYRLLYFLLILVPNPGKRTNGSFTSCCGKHMKKKKEVMMQCCWKLGIELSLTSCVVLALVSVHCESEKLNSTVQFNRPLAIRCC